MTVALAPWVARVVPSLLERRFSADVVTVALSASRLYADPPSVDPAGRLSAVVVPAPGGTSLQSPLKVAVRIHDDDVLDFSCACRPPHVCDHVLWLLVDVAFHPALRTALIEGAPTDDLVRELPRARARAVEARTLDERLGMWLPSRTFDDELEIDVDVLTIANPSLGEERAAVLLRHRRRSLRGLLSAKEVLSRRLRPRHRRMVDLTAPYHADRNALVAVRGQATLLVHLLREETGLFAKGFKGRVRFASKDVCVRVERDGDRLVARWYGSDGAFCGAASETLLLAGPFPHVWVPETLTFHPVSELVDLDMAMGMHRVPSLPLDGDTAAQVGRALLGRGRGLGVALPRPEVFGLPPLEKPTFELRLTGSPLDLRGELSAVYAAGKVSIGEERAVDGRDVEAESAGIAAVIAAGFVASGDSLMAAEERAVSIWQSGLAALRASETPRFEVLVADSMARTKVIDSPVTLDVRVSTDAGWLDTALEFSVGSLRVEIERMHRALANRSRWVVLSDGGLAKISDRVETLFREVAPLYQGSDAAKLPPHQFGRIARWIELADGAPSAVRVHIDDRAAALRLRVHDVAARPEPKLPSRFGATLRPYQVVGLAWLNLLRELGVGGLLADDMGLGKTLMTLAFLARWKEDAARSTSDAEQLPSPVDRPSLIVCSTSVVGNWLREAARFTPGLRVLAFTGAERKHEAVGDHDLVVTTYGLLRRDIERLAKIRFRAVVLDEAQNIKNPASDTARAARRLDGEMHLGLTGTPVENRLAELWSLMSFANPGILGTAADFDTRYERPIAMRPDGDVARELRALVRPFVLRRSKRDVLVDLPPKTEVERTCVLGLRQRRAYDALALSVRQAVRTKLERRGGARVQLSVLTAILRLRQMACDPRLVDPEAFAADSAKRLAFLELVRELVAEDRRALVFSQFVELFKLWRSDLDQAKVSYEVLDGSTRNRDEVVDRFQRGGASLFLVSLKAGGAGLNLTAADTVIHCDPWWNPAAENQATDRAHRIGQTRPVTVVRLVAEGTIEAKIALLKQKKHELASAVIDEDSSALDGRDGLRDEDVSFLLGDVDRVAGDEEESDDRSQES